MTVLLATVLVGTRFLGAADDSTSAAGPKTQSEQIARLEAALATQQAQLEALQRAVERQQKLLENATNSAKSEPTPPASLGAVASLTPFIPAAPAAMPAAASLQKAPAPATKEKTPGTPCDAPPDGNAVPAYIRLGNTCIVPVGFMDLTAVWRDKAAGSSLGTNFGSVPYNNTVAAKNSEFRFTPQNSRLGVRVDGDWKGTHFIGYNEFDFLGTSGGNNLGVTNGAFVPRLRLFWIDARKGPWEFLAGQSWSMLTPSRKGIAALPGDLFYSQVIDVNYMAGLTWTRQPGMRVLYHPSSTLTMGISIENPNQYIGGSAGGSSVVLPTALATLAGSQLDNGSNVLVTPNLHPDIIAKVSFDPSSRFHGEIAGIERTFKVWDPLNNKYSTKVGGGVSVNANVEVVKNFRVVTNNYWSDGGGRYLFGQVPDLIVHADGSISALHAGGTVDGIEATVRNWLLYAYYGGIYLGRNVALDANGSKVGYGFAGSPNSQNRTIQEFTFGFNQTIWKSPRYGAINAMGQYEYLTRNPWAVATGAPKSAHDNTIYFNLRYTLPGAIPAF